MSQLKDVFKLFLIVGLLAIGWGISFIFILAVPEKDQKPPKILFQISSPDKENIVYVYEHNCGATCGFRTFVSINNKSTPFKIYHNTVFCKDGYPEADNLNITWSHDKKILIKYKISFDEKVYANLSKHEDIEILYNKLE